MAIFSNNDIQLESGKTDANTTIITAGAKIKGEIELTCNLYIDGELEGEIHSQKQINVGKTGQVKGSIVTDVLIVQGFVEGTIDADKISIKAGGHVKGEILSAELVIESKGIFEGTSVIKTNSDIKNQKAIHNS